MPAILISDFVMTVSLQPPAMGKEKVRFPMGATDNDPSLVMPTHKSGMHIMGQAVVRIMGKQLALINQRRGASVPLRVTVSYLHSGIATRNGKGGNYLNFLP